MLDNQLAPMTLISWMEGGFIDVANNSRNTDTNKVSYCDNGSDYLNKPINSEHTLFQNG